MTRAQLEAMTLEELHEAAAEQGVLEAPGLPRDALIDRLCSMLAPRGKSPSARSAAPGGKEQRKAARDAGIPSGVAPDCPSEQNPDAMARLYFEQGEPERAADLYRMLLALHPDDEELAARLAGAEAAVRERAQKQGVAVPAAAAGSVPRGEPLGMLDFEELPEAYGVDECEVMAKDPHWLFVYWEVTEHGLANARRDLGDEGGAARLVLRLFIHAAGEKGPDRDSRDQDLDWNHGRRYFPSPRPGMRVRAAVGLVTPSGLFAPIAHSSQVRVPPTEPAATFATEWMEVRPAVTSGRESEPIEIIKRGPAAGERGVGASVGPVAAGADTAAPERGQGENGSSWRWGPGSHG